MIRRIEFEIGSLDKAKRLFQTGLKHGILPLPAIADAVVGDPILVVLTLQFSGEPFELAAKVMHSGAASTVVKLDHVPRSIVEAVTGPPDGPERPPAREPTALPAAAPAPATTPTPDSAPSPPRRGFRLKGPGGSARPAATPRKPRPGTASQYSLDRTPDSGGGPAIPIPGAGGRTVKGALEEEGSLEDRDMRALLMGLLGRFANGVLVVEGYREVNWCFVVNGKPVMFEREPPSRSDAIDYQASRARLVEPDDLNRARQLSQLTGRRMEEVLLQLELLSEEQLMDLRAKTAWQVTERLLGVNYGTFRFYGLPGLDRILTGAPADIMGVLWARAREKYATLSDKKINQRIDQYHKHHMVLTDEGKEMAPQLSLGVREALFVKRYLRGGWQIAELLGRLDLTNRAVMEIVFTLQDLGIIQLSEREGPNWRLARAERFLIDRMDYMGKDHFAFVDAHWTSLERELLAACDKVTRTLDDPVLNQLELGSVSRMRHEITDKLAEVRRMFADRDARRAYRTTLLERSKLSMATSLFAKQGEMALFKREATVAKECFERVIELDTGGPGAGHVSRAQRVLGDISRGVLTEAVESKVEKATLPTLEDIDKG